MRIAMKNASTASTCCVRRHPSCAKPSCPSTATPQAALSAQTVARTDSLRRTKKNTDTPAIASASTPHNRSQLSVPSSGAQPAAASMIPPARRMRNVSGTLHPRNLTLVGVAVIPVTNSDRRHAHDLPHSLRSTLKAMVTQRLDDEKWELITRHVET